MSSMQHGKTLRPDELANALDLWALRREKILALLDVRAARKARRLACTCRLLAEPSTLSALGEDMWRGEWRRTREEVLETLSEARPNLPSQPSEASANEWHAGSASFDNDPEGDRETCPGFFGDSIDDTQHDAPTRAVDWSEMEPEEDRPTRVTAISWPEESHDRCPEPRSSQQRSSQQHSSQQRSFERQPPRSKVA